jgi:SSS family solute:Na+ symporter
MPLFVIAIVYGLLWRKVTSQGALTGYLAGAVAGAMLRFVFHFDVAPVTLISGAVALCICPIASLGGRLAKTARTDSLDQAFEVHAAAEAVARNKIALTMTYIGTWILGFGFLVFLAGVLMGSQSAARASEVAILGMLIYFAGGALRAKFV